MSARARRMGVLHCIFVTHGQQNDYLSQTPKFNNTPEFIIAEIKKRNTKLLVVVVYSRPSALSPYFLFKTLSTLIPLYQNIIIARDINAGLLSHFKNETTIHNSRINNHNLLIVSNEPTHHVIYSNPNTPSSHTTLGIFIVKHIQNAINFTESSSPFITGHDFIKLTLNIESPKPP